MTDSPKRRGRPKGDGVNDNDLLTEVADLLVAEPKLRPTTAMRRLRRSADATEIRRFQMKWQTRGARFLTEARSRVARVRDASAQARGTPARKPISRYVSPSQIGGPLASLINEPVLKSALAALSPTIGTIRDEINGPTIRGILAAQRAVAGCVIGGVYSDPGLVALLRVENDPVLKAIREQERLINLATGNLRYL